MVKWIDVEVEGVHGRFALRDDLAPKTAKALWDNLPFETALHHGKLSGEACYCDVAQGSLASLPERPELGVTSIYKGWIVAFPSPSRGMTEFLIGYGTAEYRWPTGRRYVIPVAELEGDGSALFAVLRRTHDEGSKTIAVRRSE